MDRLSLPGFFADPITRQAWCNAQWAGDGPGSIDPLKEVDAAQARCDMGISTLDAESIRHDGVDWETKHRQQIKERAARQAGNLLPSVQTPAPPPVVPQPDMPADE